MASTSDISSSMDETLKALLPFMNGEHEQINRSQLLHRLKILRSWFGEEVLSSPTNILKNSTILEIGCGQGDMTVTLAYYTKRVLAVDPAPLDYGSPMTLGQAQTMISQDKLVGSKIEWVNRDPIEYLKDLAEEVDFVVLAHSIFYMASQEYLLELLRSLSQFFSSGKKTRLLVAEWGMRASVPAAEAHVLAAKAQATNPGSDGNVRNLVSPEQIKELAGLASWKMEKEVWIERPDVADGKWEVGLARTMAREESSIDAEARDFLEMERVVGELGGVEHVRSMDVWTGILAL